MEAPDISVVVPTFERVTALEGCLHALAAQSLPPSRFEVIVCDDGSRVPVTDSHAATLRALADGMQVRVIRQPNSGPAAARNRGAAVALGRYLAFTDDDCRPASDWLERLLDAFGAHPDALLGGGLRTTAGSDLYARATQAIMDFVYVEQERRGALRLFSTSNLALPSEGFQRLRGFSRSFRRASGEDYDLCARWYGTGGRVEYVADAVVVHHHSLTLTAYLLQHFSYGRGLKQMQRRLRAQGLDVRRLQEHRVPGFYVRLVLAPLRAGGLRAAPRAALVALAQAATAVGGLCEMLHPSGRAVGVASARGPKTD